MSRWHLIVNGQPVRTIEAPDKWAAEAILGTDTGYIVSAPSWAVRTEVKVVERRCGCGRMPEDGRLLCSACRNRMRRTRRRADVND